MTAQKRSRSRWPERAPVGDRSDPRGFEVLIARYLEHLEVIGSSPRTITTSRSQLVLFAEWCAERGVVRPREVERTLVERYQRWLFHWRRENGKGLAIGTQRQRLHRVKRFFAWLTEERYLLYDPASGLTLPKKPMRLPVEVLSVAEVEQILSTLDVETPLGLRDRALVEVFYSTGIRRAEAAAQDLWDIDADRGCLVVRQGKGQRDRVVPIGERALAWVDRYVETGRPQLLPPSDEWALFVNNQGTRWAAEALGHRMRQILEASGVRKRWGACHLFRHTMATLMLEGGADVRYVQEMLGHAKLDTTQIYTQVSITKLKEVHEKTHPGARLQRRREVDNSDVFLESVGESQEEGVSSSDGEVDEELE